MEIDTLSVASRKKSKNMNGRKTKGPSSRSPPKYDGGKRRNGDERREEEEVEGKGEIREEG